ncbi:MAG: hypothetical protein QM594_14720 [Niabella sp.]
MVNLNVTDLPDSEKDKKELRPDKAVIDLPDIEDIPGQENVKPSETSQAENLTIASDDEEGTGVMDDGEETDELTNDISNVTKEERELLKASETVYTADDDDLNRAGLDNEDFEGEKLNEHTDRDGKDLDVPGQEEDDADEDRGEEDEENNEYSLSDNK